MIHVQSLAALTGKILETWLRDPDRYRHHGIGVLQGYVLESSPPEAEYRIHVWHPKLRLPEMDDSGLIHDHRFNLESTVIFGKVIHTVYELDPTERGVYQAWSVENARSAEQNVGKRVGWVQLLDPTRFNITPITFRYHTGESYVFPKRCFHRTDVDGLSITICRKLDQEETSARILARHGKEPRHGFAHDAREHAVIQRGILTDAIQALRGIARAA